jgi:hypothetical protein
MNIYDLFKGASHKYKYRKLTGHDKQTGRPKYRYYYDYHHGGGIHSAEHFEEGSKFEFTHGNQRGHFHVDSIKGDKVTVTHDEIEGFSVTFSKKEFSALLKFQHKKALQETAKKRRATYEKMKAKTPKHIGLKLAKRRAEELEALAEVEVKPSKKGASALEKSILEKHSVSVSQLSDHFEIWREEGYLKHQDKFFQKKMRSLAGENPDRFTKPPENPYDRHRNFDKWLARKKEIGEIFSAQYKNPKPEERAERAEPSLKAYNSLLDRSAEENREVLKAVEVYKAKIDTFDQTYNPDSFLEETFESFINPFLEDPRLKEHTRDQVLSLSWEEYEDLVGRYTARHLSSGVAEFDSEETYRKKAVWGKDSTVGERLEKIKARIKKPNWTLPRPWSAEWLSDPKHKGRGVWEDRQTTRDMDNFAETQKARNYPNLEKLGREKALRVVAREEFEKLKREVSKACAGFDTTPTQEAHVDHWCKKGKRKAFPRISGHLAKVEEIFKKAYPDRKKKTQFEFKKNVRACFDGEFPDEPLITLANDTDHKSASHEMGHSLEYMKKGDNTILDVGTLTHLTRIERGKIKTLPFGRREAAFDDEYIELYTGKLYDGGATELVSMGVQELLGDPKTQAEDQANFALRDPHHFLITYGILKGYAKL